MYTIGGNVRTLSERDGDAAPEIEAFEPEVRKNGSFQENAFDKVFNQAVERFGLKDDDDTPAPARKQSADPLSHDELRTRSIKSLDKKLDEKLTEHYAAEEDSKAFESAKGLAARDYLSGAFGELGKFSDIVERFLDYGDAFKADPINAAERFIRDFRASRFRADRAEQLKVDRTPPEISGHRRDWFIEQSMGHVERGDTLTRKQIGKLKELFPETPIDGIFDTLASLAREGFSDAMGVAAKLAHATGAPRSEAELETWQHQEAQREQQAQAAQIQQRQLGQQMQETAIRLMQAPGFPRTGDPNTDYAAALHAVQQNYQNEQREVQAAHREIEGFTARHKPPYFDQLRPTMASFLQNGYVGTLQEAYEMAVRPLMAAERERQSAVAKAKRAAPIRSSTGSSVGHSGGSSSPNGLSGHLQAAIDRYILYSPSPRLLPRRRSHLSGQFKPRPPGTGFKPHRSTVPAPGTNALWDRLQRRPFIDWDLIEKEIGRATDAEMSAPQAKAPKPKPRGLDAHLSDAMSNYRED